VGSYKNFVAVGFGVSCCGTICGFAVSVATNIFDRYRSMSDAARRIEEDVTARALLATVDRDNERAARELKDDEMARSLLAEADGNNQMYKTVKVSSPHIKRVNTVALKFEAFVAKVERVVIERYPNIPRKWENGVENKNKVEPWPSSGMFLPLVEMYMTQYVKNVKPKLGYTVPAKRTVQNHEDVVYIAALARCKFTADEQGTAERQKTKMRAYGRLSSGQQKKDMSSFVKKMILTLGPVFQEDRTVKDKLDVQDEDYLQITSQGMKYRVNLSVQVCAMIGFFGGTGKRPSTALPNDGRTAGAAEATNSDGERKAFVFRGILYCHVAFSKWIENGMVRVLTKVTYSHLKGLAAGEKVNKMIEIFPGVKGSSIETDGSANIFAAAFRKGIFEEQQDGVSDADAIDAILGSPPNFNVKEEWLNRPLFCKLSKASGAIEVDQPMNGEMARSNFRVVSEEIAGAKPLSTSLYCFRKGHADGLLNGKHGGKEKAQAGLDHTIGGTTFNAYVVGGQHLDAASIKRGNPPRKKLDASALQVAGVRTEERVAVDDPRVLALIAKDTRVAAMLETLPKKEERSTTQRMRLCAAKSRVRAQCHMQVLRQQYDARLTQSYNREEFNADNGVLTIGQLGPTGSMVAVEVGRLATATKTTLRAFCLSRTNTAAPDRTCLLEMEKLKPVPQDMEGQVGVHRLSERTVMEMFESHSVVVVKGSSNKKKRTFHCAGCDDEGACFSSSSRNTMWLHINRVHRDKKGIVSCNRCGKFCTTFRSMRVHLATPHKAESDMDTCDDEESDFAEMMEDNDKYHEFIEENFEKGTEEDVIHIKDMMYIFQNSELRNEKKSQIKQEFLKRGYVYDSKKRKKINKKDKRGFFIGIKQIEDSSDHEVSDSQGQGERRERSERSEEVEDERSEETVGRECDEDFETALDDEVLERSEEAVESGWDTTVRSTQEQSPTHSGEDSSDFELYFSDSSYFSESDEQ